MIGTIVSAIYTRVSTTDQTTTREQGEDIQGVCRKTGRKIYCLVEEKKTAKADDDMVDVFEYLRRRPVLASLYEDAKQGKFNELLVWKWDRLSRSTAFLDLLINIFRQVGVTCVAIRDSDNPLTRRIVSAVNEEEIDKIKARVELVHQDRLKKKRVLNRPPLGYKFKRHKLVPDENFEAIKQVFELEKKGLKPKQICSQIMIKRNRKKIPLPLSTCYLVLKNKRFYIDGYYSYREEEIKGEFETVKN